MNDLCDVELEINMMSRLKRANPLRKQRYAIFVNWVRKTHGWIGLWGALLGLIFGVSGIWLNHRAVLKLPPMAQTRSKLELQITESDAATPEKLAVWLEKNLQLNAPPNQIRIEPGKALPWNAARETEPSKLIDSESPVALVSHRQPERWQFNFGGPNSLTQAEYWVGNKSVSVQNIANGFLATLTNLHKGTGMSVPWILLIDTLAGSMIFLSISGVILWVQMNRRRALGISIFSVSTCITLAMIGMRI